MDVPTVQEIFSAKTRMAGLVARTPLRYAPLLSQATGSQVYLKLENWQHTGSFKVRGAVNKVACLTAEERARGLVTASAGNHALGVAYAAQALGGMTTTIFLPETAPQSKVLKLKQFDCQLRFVGSSYEEAHHAAEAYQQGQGATYIHAYDDPLVVAGAGTIGLEVLEDWPGVEAMVVPVGGGGLISGMAIVAKALNPAVQIIGVQAAASPALADSLRHGRLYEEYEARPTMADGLAGGVGRLAFQLAQRGTIDQVVVVEEEEIQEAVHTLLDREQLVVEGSGAVGLAALQSGRVSLEGKKVALVLTGANIDTALLHQIMTRHPSPSPG